MGLGKRIMQILILAATWMGWDFYAKDWFISLISGGSETPGLAEIFLSYLTPFVLAFILSSLVIKMLGIDRPEESESEYG